MNRRVWAWLFLWLGSISLALVLAFGCSGALSPGGFGGSGAGGSSSAGNPMGSSGALGGCGINCDGVTVGTGPSNTIDITPKNVSLAVINGVIPMQVFKAMLNGQDVSNTVSWSYERPDIGDVMNGGSTFTPTGKVGGTGKLTATLNMSTGSTGVQVSIRQTLNPGNLTAQQQGQFANPNGGPDTVQIVYPYPETVFPLGVVPPEIQWNNGGAADVYELKMVEKYYQYTAYLSAPPPSRFLPDAADWTAIEESGSGPKTDPLQVTLTRMSGSTVYQPEQVILHIAQGRLHGSIYYWELPDQCGNANQGRILRIKPDDTMVDPFFTAGGTCYGCHTVSRDGKTMMAAFSNGSPFPQQTIDLTQNPAQYGKITQAQGLGGTFSAFNDKGDRIIISNDAAGDQSAVTLRIVDANNGSSLNANAMGNGCAEPAWSPDGKTLAGICGLNSFGWVFDAPSGNLTLADVAADGFTVSNLRTLPTAGQGRPAYPTFTPGSEYIAYGRPTTGSRSTGNGQLWLIGADGSNPKELTTAEAGLNNSYNPVFAPLRAGGYFWIVFISRRDYGNELVGADPNNFGVPGRTQLWVTAIDDPPSAADPSHPAWFIRGQEMCAFSENAYYALDPCKKDGDDCLSGVDCCGGQCVKDPMTGKYTCNPPMGMCSGDGNSCKMDSDCCNAPTVSCIDGFCQSAPPK